MKAINYLSIVCSFDGIYSSYANKPTSKSHNHFDLLKAEKFLFEKQSDLSANRLIIRGGEPFKHYEEITSLSKMAICSNFEVELLTTCSWINDYKSAKQKIDNLANIGVGKISVITDTTNINSNSVWKFKHFVKSVVEIGIDFSFIIRHTNNGNTAEKLLELEEFNSNTIKFIIVPLWNICDFLNNQKTAKDPYNDLMYFTNHKPNHNVCIIQFPCGFIEVIPLKKVFSF